MQLKLIDDWNKAHRFLSVQVAAGFGLLAAAYDYLPAVHDYLPDGWAKWAALVIIAARVIHQGDKGAPAPAAQGDAQ